MPIWWTRTRANHFGAGLRLAPDPLHMSRPWPLYLQPHSHILQLTVHLQLLTTHRLSLIRPSAKLDWLLTTDQQCVFASHLKYNALTHKSYLHITVRFICTFENQLLQWCHISITWWFHRVCQYLSGINWWFSSFTRCASNTEIKCKTKCPRCLGLRPGNPPSAA